MFIVQRWLTVSVSENSPVIYRCNKQVFPTLLSPRMIILMSLKEIN